MNQVFYVIWKRPIAVPLLADFHFGVPEQWDHALHFSTFDDSRNGEIVSYSKNVFTMGSILGEHSIVLSGALFPLLKPLIICKYRTVQFAKPFLMPWTTKASIDFYQEYLAIQNRRCELEGIAEDQIEFAFGHDPEHAYQFYKKQHAVSFSPESDYFEVLTKISSESFWNHRDKGAAIPDDLLVVGPTTVSGTDFLHVTLNTFCESVVEPRHRSQIFVSPAELEKFGILKANARAYFCRPDIYALLEPHLDPVFWCYQPVTQDMIPTQGK